MKYKKILIFVMFLLVISILSIVNTNSYAGYDDLIVMGVGCAVGGLWNPIWGGGQCNIWSPPKKGNCEKCNINPLQECSEYQCKAIGKNCNLLNGQCVDMSKDDTKAPRIINCKKLSKYEEYQGKRAAVYNEDVCNFGEVVKGKGVVATLTTDEFAMCKLDIELDKDFDEMLESNYFEIFNEFSVNHYLIINPGEELTEDIINKNCENGECRLFIRCSDVTGNKMKYDYAFVFEIKGAGEDITPPSIEFSDIDSGYTMKYNDNVLDFGLVVDDGTGVRACKYSKDEDKDYNEMDTMTCYGERPAACSATLSNIINEQENKFYFRCEDKKGNVDNVGKELIINGGNLLGMQISIPAKVTRTSKISVVTSGGSDNNNALCYYKCDKCDIKDYILFDSTGANNHEQELYFVPNPSNYDVKIKCEDNAGDIVEETKSLVVGALTLNVKLLETKIDKQKIDISIQTSDGEKNGEADCNLFRDDNIKHNYGDLESKGSENLDENKHVFEVNDLQNKHYDWIVVCKDIPGNENYVLVSFDINTPNLDMNINPSTGTTLPELQTRVTITTTNGINNGASVCRIKAPETGFIDKDQFEGEDIENGKKSSVHVIDLPSATGRFGQPNNVYYIVCRDDAGKTNGQIVTYNINLAESDLKFSDFKLDDKDELKTDKINPILSFVTTGGINRDGIGDCDVECSQNEDNVYGSSSNTNIHVIKFSNLKDGSYNCKISCRDPEFLEREAREVDKSFVVETPALNINVISPQGDVEIRNLRLIIDTFGGINNGQADCYYTENLVDGFEVNNIIDITRVEGISYYYMATKIYSYPVADPVAGNKYTHVGIISGEVRVGENTLYVQCKDRVGKLAPSAGPERVVFNVIS